MTQYLLNRIEHGGSHQNFWIKCPKTDGENPCFDQEIDPEVIRKFLHQKELKYFLDKYEQI